MPPRQQFGRSSAGRLRGTVSAVLLILACALVPLGALAGWVTYGLADGDRYVRTVAPLAADPAVEDVVADTLGTGLARRAGVGEMAPFLRDAVRSFTRTDAFQVGWDEANRATHDAVLDAVRRGERGPVTVDLAPVADAVERQLAEDNALVGRPRLPVGHAEVAVLPAADLGPLRKGLHVMQVAAVWLPLTAVALAVAAIALAARRRRALTAMALGVAAGGALLGVAVALGRHLTLADLPADMPEPAAGAVYDALTSTLRTVSWLLLALGATVALACRLGRPLRRGTERTEAVTPVTPVEAREAGKAGEAVTARGPETPHPPPPPPLLPPHPPSTPPTSPSNRKLPLS
ncbi:hypothetical protein AB0D49_32415 [Streptomyces sp. NPDC048290]|uniref:hypothetical protein n=1 Tax=Streptomyces sp. NPDC048290 TaxID=3155811 RepID=UPI0034213DD2